MYSLGLYYIFCFVSFFFSFFFFFFFFLTENDVWEFYRDHSWNINQRFLFFWLQLPEIKSVLTIFK